MMLYGADAFGYFWERCKRVLLVVVVTIVIVTVVSLIPTWNFSDHTKKMPVYDATCTDVAHQALERCVEGPSRPCGGIYGPVYTACRDEVLAGRAVHLNQHRFVPGGISPTCDCTDAVGVAMAATVERCSQVLDCKNFDLHPQDCSADCKYHALEGAFQLGPLD